MGILFWCVCGVLSGVGDNFFVSVEKKLYNAYSYLIMYEQRTEQETVQMLLLL